MEKRNHLDELPIANLNDKQLEVLRNVEQRLNQEGNPVYLIAFEKQQ